MKRLLFLLAIALLLVCGTMIVRTLRFASKQMSAPAAPEIALDIPAMAARLGRAIQFRTVSQAASSDSGAGEFLAFHRFLRAAFPRIHATLTYETVGDYSLLYTWPGTNRRLKPVLFMGHLDVVPVDPASEKQWRHPPFAGRVTGGFIWGRGALDDKVGVLASMEAIEWLLSAGFQPQRTVYLAFGHDEELGGGNGAARIADLLKARRVQLEYVLDEGGFITDGIIPGIRSPLGLIGIAEKGYATLELSAETAGGHTASPPPQSAIGIVSSAIHNLERKPFRARISQPTRRLLDTVGPELAWTARIALANLWLFEPLVKAQLDRSAASRALLRTTLAATLFQAGVQDNVLPARASAMVNVRILPGETVAQVIEHARAAVADARVNIALLNPAIEPSTVSDPESAAFKLIQRTVAEIAPGTLVAPSLLVAATDSRHYAALASHTFRFLPVTLRPEDVARFHGIDERLAVKDYERCVRFFIQLTRNSAG